MVVTIYKYTVENNVTKKRKKKKNACTCGEINRGRTKLSRSIGICQYMQSRTVRMCYSSDYSRANVHWITMKISYTPAAPTKYVLSYPPHVRTIVRTSSVRFCVRNTHAFVGSRPSGAL